MLTLAEAIALKFDPRARDAITGNRDSQHDPGGEVFVSFRVADSSTSFDQMTRLRGIARAVSGIGPRDIRFTVESVPGDGTESRALYEVIW